MINHYDIAYSFGVGLTAPYWLVKGSARRKVLGAFRERMGDVPTRNTAEPAVMIHAVSVGELNATTSLVKLLRRVRPGLQFIISTTTTAGYARSKQLYGNDSDVSLVRYPLDFSRGVTRLLDRLQPSVVVLMELEVWPNFLRHCRRRHIPVVLANGRMSVRSYQNYRLFKPVIASMFRGLSDICAQDETYSQKFVELGADPRRVHVVGNIKFDTAEVGRRITGDVELAEAVGLFPGQQPIWVCGSTGPGEEEIILRVYRTLLNIHTRLRLVIVPRHEPRFNEVAQMIEAAKFRVVRRSIHKDTTNLPAPAGAIPPVVLGDTFGELRKFYALASVVFVGRSLVDLGSKQHGSDMIEPAGLGKPVVVGPFTANFADAMHRLRQAEGVLIVRQEEQLAQTIHLLLTNTEEAWEMGSRAQDVVLREQGATLRHAQVILDQLDTSDNEFFKKIGK